MALAFFCLWAVLAAGLGVLLATRGKTRKSAAGFDVETATGVWVTSISPMAALFYICSPFGTMLIAITLPVMIEDRFSSPYGVVMLVIGVLMVVLPMWWFVRKWRERTVIDREGLQFPRLLGRPVRLSWDDIEGLDVTEHRGWTRGGMRRFTITEVNVRTKDKVYKPTWDRATWARNSAKIIAAIVSHANLVAAGEKRWARP